MLGNRMSQVQKQLFAAQNWTLKGVNCMIFRDESKSGLDYFLKSQIEKLKFLTSLFLTFENCLTRTWIRREELPMKCL